MSSEKGSQTVLWWLGWIGLTLVSFFVSCFFWTRIIADHMGPIDAPGVAVWWLVAVFGSWMVLLVPLIVLMYNKVDKSYEDARLARESNTYQKVKEEIGVRCVSIDEAERRLKKELSEKLKSSPETLKRGHLVTAVLKNGRHIKNIFVLDRKEVLGVYGVDKIDFEITDIVDVITLRENEPLPDFKADKWLRLDGVGKPV